MIQTIIVGITTRDPDNAHCSRRIEAALNDPHPDDIDRSLRLLFDKCVNDSSPRVNRHDDDAEHSRSSSTGGGRQRLATEKQLRAIEAMAKKQGFDLRRHLHDELGTSRLSELSIREASNLIDRLKEQTASA